MPPAARISDMHVCPMVTPGLPPVPHVGGPILPPGCPTVLIGFMPAARVGDMATCVGPPDAIAMGSTTVLIGYMPAARVGDTTTHGGTVVVGCPTVLIGDAGGGGGGGAAGAGPGGPPAQVINAYKTGTSASVGPVPPEHTGPLQPEEEEKKKTWIGVILKDFKGQPMPNQNFQVTLDKGQVLKGRTDEKGYARFDNLDPDSGNVVFSELTEIKDQETAQGGPGQQPAGAQTMDYDSKPLPQLEPKESVPDKIPENLFGEDTFFEEED